MIASIAKMFSLELCSVWSVVPLLLVLLSVRPVVPETNCMFAPGEQPCPCEELTYTPCLDVLNSSTTYQTTFPNLLQHGSQQEAIATLNQTANITDILHSMPKDCSRFICLLFFPVCTLGVNPYHPCRELCTCVYEGCLRDLRSAHNWQWYDEIHCDPLVSNADGMRCSSFPDTSCSVSTPCTPPSSCTTSPTSAANTLPPVHSPSLPNATGQLDANCTGQLVPHPDNTSAGFNGIHGCVESCSGAFLAKDQQSFVQGWIAVWSLLCLIFSTAVFLTFLLTCKKVRLSPSTPIYYLSLSYAFLSLVYIVTVAVGRDRIICNHDYTNEQNETALVTEGLKFPLCVTVFAFLYYATLCTWSWWLALSLQWAAACWLLGPLPPKYHVGSHLVGWGGPLVFLLSAVLSGNVSGDAILGMCWVRPGSELPFLVVPLLVVMVLNSAAILVCFGRIVYVQKHGKLDNDDSNGLSTTTTTTNVVNTRSLMRIGLYSTVYLLAAGTLLCCYSYDHWFRPQWEYWYVHCRDDLAWGPVCSSVEGPRFPLFLVKFFASIAMGMVSLVWIANKSCYSAWRRVLCSRWGRQWRGGMSFNVEADAAVGQVKEEQELPDHLRPTSQFTFRESSI